MRQIPPLKASDFQAKQVSCPAALLSRKMRGEGH
jgi:hypothetical protein